MTLALALTVHLLTAAGGCFFVSNTRIVVVPSCDFSPGAIAALEAEEPPPKTRSVDPPRRSAVAPRPTRRAVTRRPPADAAAIRTDR